MAAGVYIEELREVIRKLHGVESTHVESVPVREIYQGETVWDGIVEVFELRSHPKASRAYAWARNMDNPQRPRQRVAVLHLGPVNSPAAAVKAAIVQEFRNFGTAEEE